MPAETPFDFSVLPDAAASAFRDQSETMRKMLKGVDEMRNLRRSDLEIGTSPKELVYQDGHLRVFRYAPVLPPERLLAPRISAPAVLGPARALAAADRFHRGLFG